MPIPAAHKIAAAAQQLVFTKWRMKNQYGHQPRQDFRARSTFQAKGALPVTTQVIAFSTWELQTLDDLLLPHHIDRCTS